MFSATTHLNRGGYGSIRKTFRFYSKDNKRKRSKAYPPPLPQYEPPKRLRRMSRICPPLPQAHPPPKAPSTGLGATLVGLALISWGVIAFAKYNSNFRETLNEKIPFTDDLVKLLYEEEKSFVDNIRDFFDKFW